MSTDKERIKALAKKMQESGRKDLVKEFSSGGPLDKPGNTKKALTEEEYIDEQIQRQIDSALEKSRTRKVPAVPTVRGDRLEEIDNHLASKNNLKSFAATFLQPWAKSDSEGNLIHPEFAYKDKNMHDYYVGLAEHQQDLADEIAGKVERGELKRFYDHPGASCIYTATDNYGNQYRVMGNQTFLQNPEKFGFVQISPDKVKPGDIVQDIKGGTPFHAMIYDGADEGGIPRYNYSKGVDAPEDIVIRGKYPLKEFNAFRFVGTPQDSLRWKKEYLADEFSDGGAIHIKPSKRGTFIAAAQKYGKSVQAFASQVLAHKENYSPAMVKKANFARNAAKWHAEGGPIDYSGISTTNNRAYNPDYISYIDTSLQKGGMNPMQRASVLANIIEESGGDPFAEGPGGFYGLLQWSDERYPRTNETDVYKEIDNQVKSILATANNASDHMSWTHGGKGSGYNSLKDAMAAYNGDNLDDVMRGYTLGYVRPAGGIDSFNNRLKVARQLYEKEGFLQPVSAPVNNKIRTENMAGKVMSIMKDRSRALELVRKYSGVR